jgi:type II secretory pathway component PulF
MSQADDPRPPRSKPPGNSSKPKSFKTTDADLGWRQPTEPDEEVLRRPKSKSSKEPIAATGGPKMVERVLFGRVSSSHLASFCRQFATYSDAGVDLLKSLGSLQKQFNKTALGPILGRAIEQVRSGEALSDAFAHEPEAFDRLFLSMLRVAEARGGIPETMRTLADQYDARVRLVRQARSAMIYPVIVLILAGGVMALLSFMLLPMFASFLAELAGGPNGAGGLPLPSRMLMAFAQFMKAAGWWLAPLLSIGFIVFAFQAYRTKPGKAAIDELGLMTPVVGKLLRLIETARFSRVLASLLHAGVDVNSALVLTSEVQRIEPFRKALLGANDLVKEGSDLSQALDDSHRFTTDVIAVVSSGEETGMIPESLDKVADDYEEQVTYMVKNLGSFIQPLIMVGMGLLVLFIILAVFLPYLQILTNLGK